MLATLDPRTWWFATRATGIVAWALLAASVIWGLMLSSRSFGRAAAPAWLLDLHRYLGGLAVVFTAMHIGSIASDDFVPFGWRDLFVPLASTWKPTAVAWGIVAFYLLLAVEATSLLQRQLPRRLWRAVHYLSFPLFVMATVHLATAGSDGGNPALQWSAVIVCTIVGFLVIVRIAVARSKPATRPARATAGTPDVADDPRAAMLARARAARAAKTAEATEAHGPPAVSLARGASPADEG